MMLIFFAVNRTSETVLHCYCCKNNTLRKLRFQGRQWILLRPPN